MNKIKTYLEEVLAEMRKVNWPKRRELIDNTLITLFATVLLSLFIYGADRVIGYVLNLIYT